MRLLFLVSMFFYLAMSITKGYCQSDDATKWQEANDLNANGNYTVAIESYMSISDYDHRPDVLYNMGNAYISSGQLGKAVWSYEQAYRLAPSDKTIQHNLNAARQRIINPYQDQRFVLTRWWHNQFNLLSMNVWAILVLFVAITIGLIIGFKNRIGKTYRFILPISVFVFFWIGTVLYYGIINLGSNGKGIAIREVEQLYNDVSLSEGIDRNLPEGTMVEIIDVQDKTAKVRLPNGIEAYINEDVIWSIH